MGYKNPQKFLQHKKEWDAFEREIPREYLRYIGIERRVLEFTAELDYDDYKRALELPRYPQKATVRYMPAVYGGFSLPEGIDEEKAIILLKEFAREKNLRCCIHYCDLLTVFVEPRGQVWRKLYPPGLKFTRAFLIPYNREKEFAKTRWK